MFTAILFNSTFGKAAFGNYPMETETAKQLAVRDIICNLHHSAICFETLLAFFKSNGKLIEFQKYLAKIWPKLQIKSAFQKDQKCKIRFGKEKFGNEILLKEIGIERTNLAVDLKEVKKKILCGENALQRLRRGIGQTNGVSFENTACWPLWRGDGFCDLGCNTKQFNYDDGDCCYDTCISKIRRYPCGFTGFQCKEKQRNAPMWSKNLKLCFKWKATGNMSQCDNAEQGKICAPFGSMTKFYHDNTDARNGGCALSWSIQARQAPAWFWSRLSLCLFAYSDGNRFQCNYGNVGYERCLPANSWLHYVDDTDDRPGGCILRWRMLYLGMSFSIVQFIS